MKIEQVTKAIWRVYSDTSDRSYVVDLDIPNCTCPNWAITINKMKSKTTGPVCYKCKHILEVKGQYPTRYPTREVDKTEWNRIREQHLAKQEWERIRSSHQS